METIKIEKINEVYNKIHCEPSISYEIKDYFTFKVPNCQFIPAYRNKLWDGNIYLYNPLTCLIYGGLLEHLDEFCKKRKYNIEYLSDFSDSDFSEDQANEFIKTLNLPFEPRDYQLNAFVTCVQKHRKLMLSPTSSGKSFIIYLLVRYYNKKTLIIVPTTSLIHQLSSDFISYGLDDEDCIYKIYQGQDKDLTRVNINGKQPSIIFSTWQSIHKQPKEWFNQFELVICDESHIAKSNSITKIMTNLVECKYRFGFTGTLDGSNTHKLMLEALFGSVKKTISTSKLIENKTLSDFEIKSIVLNYKDEDKIKCSKFSYLDEINYLISLKERNEFIKKLTLSLNATVELEFDGKYIKIPINEIIPLTNGSQKVAKDITINDDINDLWIKKRLNKL